MSPRTPHLTLDEFMLEMSRDPKDTLTHKRFMNLAQRVRLSDDLIRRRSCFERDHYARNLVCRTPDFELLVLCWKPGQESTIHDHAGSLNAISMFAGELTSRLFRPAAGKHLGEGPVEMTSEERLLPGQGWTGVDRSGIHQLANTSREDLVTVHVYAPALMELTVYSTESAKVERRPLRYTLVEDLD